MLLVDDAHWLDRPSLRWLAFMVNRVADLPLAIDPRRARRAATSS